MTNPKSADELARELRGPIVFWITVVVDVDGDLYRGAGPWADFSEEAAQYRAKCLNMRDSWLKPKRGPEALRAVVLGPAQPVADGNRLAQLERVAEAARELFGILGDEATGPTIDALGQALTALDAPPPKTP